MNTNIKILIMIVIAVIVVSTVLIMYDGLDDKKTTVTTKENNTTTTPTIHDDKIPILWETQLKEMEIKWTQAEKSYANTDVEIIPPWRACSELVYPNGTSFFISSLVINDYMIGDMQVTSSQPDDCKKMWIVANSLEKIN